MASARAGARTALLEAATELGGTGVHSPVGLVCTFFDRRGRFIDRGLHQEIAGYLYTPEVLTHMQSYDETGTACRLTPAHPRRESPHGAHLCTGHCRGNKRRCRAHRDHATR